MEKKASTLSMGQTRLRISMGRLKTLAVPIPPLDLQRKFSEFVQSLTFQNLRFARAYNSVTYLFNSLQAQAFSGRLTLNALQEAETVGPREA